MNRTMDDFENWYEEWMQFSTESKKLIKSKHGCELGGNDFQDLTCAKLGHEKPVDLLYVELPDPEEFSDSLTAEDLAPFKGEDIAEIELEESVIPQGLPQLLEEDVKHGNERWRIHKNDADPFPSDPHAHMIGSKLKLHLGTGELFDKKRLVTKMRCKDLKRLRAKVPEEVELPPLEC